MGAQTHYSHFSFAEENFAKEVSSGNASANGGLFCELLGSFADIIGSFADILGFFADIIGSLADIIARLRVDWLFCGYHWRVFDVADTH